MIQKDYIERLIEQLAQAIAAIVFNKRQQQYPQAREEIKRAFNGLLGLKYDLIGTLSAKDLAGILKINPDQAPEKCRVLAELLLHDAEVYQLEGRAEESRIALHNALFLYLESYKGLGNKYDLEYKINTLIPRTADTDDIPSYLVQQIAEYQRKL